MPADLASFALDAKIIPWFAFGLMIIALTKVFWEELVKGARSIWRQVRRPKSQRKTEITISWMSPVEGAALLRVTEPTVRKYAYDGKIRYRRQITDSGREVLMLNAKDVVDLATRRNGSARP